MDDDVSIAAKLFQGLIWPAVAGNVGWSFFSVLVAEELSGDRVLARLVVLALVAVYLGVEWVITESIQDKLKAAYWLADAPFAAAMAVLAITTQLMTTAAGFVWIETDLGAVFGVVVVGHLFGAWESSEAQPADRWPGRLLLSGIHVLGAAIVSARLWLLPETSVWHLPVAILVVVGLWGVVRHHIATR